MKFIKLNRRYRQFKEYGHTVAFRFDGYTKQTNAVETALRSLTSGGGWQRGGEWYGYYGKDKHDGMRPYFITMRDEHMASLVLLKIDSSAIIA